jgi:AcrR family transcriptional regulator
MTEAVEKTRKKRMGRPPLIDNARAYILKISSQFFGKNGYERSTIAQLAQGMNMSKAFIYHYFTSKEQIIDEIALDTQKRLIERSMQRIAQSDDVIEKIRLFMLEHAEFIQDNYYEVRALDYTFAGQMSKEVEIVARRNNADYRAILVDLFRQGMEAGEIRAEDPAVAAQAVFSLVHSISRWYKPDSDPLPAAHYADKFFAMISTGIRTEPRA